MDNVFSIKNILIAVLFVFFLFVILFHKDTAKINCELLKEVNQNAKSWLYNNFREKGLFVYSYDPKNDVTPNKNNDVRQLMASVLLAKDSKNDSQLLEKHISNLNFLFEWWYKEDIENDLGYIVYDKKSKLGANAMFLRTLVHSPYFNDYQKEAKMTANGIISLINPDGSFNPWLIPPDYEYDSDYLLTFYSGEAIFALLDYYKKTEDRKYLEYAAKVQDYYIDRYVVNLEENYYPAYVPWQTISLSILYDLTGDKKYSDAIFILNDKVLELLDRKETVGRFYNPGTPQYGNPHSSSDGVYTEGLAYAYDIALKVGDTDRQKEYKNALGIAFKNLVSLQYKGDEFETDSLKYAGALRTKKTSDWIRTDTTQHTIDALNKMEEIFCLN